MGKTKALIKKAKKILTQPLFGRRLDSDEIYRAQAVSQLRAVKVLDADAKRAERRFRQYFQKWNDANRKSDEVCLYAVDNYVKAGTLEDLGCAYTILSQRLVSKEIVEGDITRYRAYADRLIDFLGSDEVGLYDRATTMANAMAEREDELGKKEKDGCEKEAQQYELSAQRFREKGKEMAERGKKSKANAGKKRALEEDVHEFVEQMFAQWMDK